MGYRFRLHRSDLPGTPDITLPKYKTVIFVHGCLWHGHSCNRGKVPTKNRKFWMDKIQKNRERDRIAGQELSNSGWKSITVWSCETTSAAKLQALKERLHQQLKPF
jgi:DNA mismatch endonuclease (patch repair protein)